MVAWMVKQHADGLLWMDNELVISCLFVATLSNGACRATSNPRQMNQSNIVLPIKKMNQITVKPVNYDHRRDWESVVLFLRWSHLPGVVQNFSIWSFVHMHLRKPSTSVIGSSHMFAGVYLATTMPSEACKRDDHSIGVSGKEKSDGRKRVFRSSWRMWSLFIGRINALGRPPVSAIRISQVVAFSRTHSIHLNPRIEGTDIACPQFSGGRFCQVVARTGLTVIPKTVGNRKRECAWGGSGW